MDYIWNLSKEQIKGFEDKLGVKITRLSLGGEHGNQLEFHSLRIYIRNGGNFYLREFPHQCSWLLAGGLSSGDKEKILEICKEFAIFMKYSGIVLSDHSSDINFWIRNGFVDVFSNYNFHSGYKNSMMVLDMTEEINKSREQE